VWESEGAWAAHRFSSIRVWKGGRQRPATRRRRLELRKEVMGKLRRYPAEKAGVGRCAGRLEKNG
jgi:hypothetical protein